MPKVKFSKEEGSFWPKGIDLKPFEGKWYKGIDGKLEGVEIPDKHWDSFCEWYAQKSEVDFEVIGGKAPKKSVNLKVVQKSTGTVDLSDLISDCTIEIKRIGLSRDDAKKLTLSRYEKTSNFMSQADLEDYLAHLKTFPTAIAEILPEKKQSAMSRQTRKDFKTWQHKYTEEGIILLVKGYLWGLPDTAIPANEDGSVNEPKFAELAIQQLENSESLPDWIQAVLENLKVAGETIRYREYFRVQKLLKSQNELIIEIAEREGKTKQQIGREMAEWAEKAGLPNHREKMSIPELESVSVYLTEVLNPTAFEYGDPEPDGLPDDDRFGSDEIVGDAEAAREH